MIVRIAPKAVSFCFALSNARVMTLSCQPKIGRRHFATSRACSPNGMELSNMLIGALRGFESAFYGGDKRRVEVRPKRLRTSVQWFVLTLGSGKRSKVSSFVYEKRLV